MERFFTEIDTVEADVIGDIHGCYNELTELLKKLGYDIDEKTGKIADAPQGRKLIFLGDFTDRGPEPVKVLKFAMNALEDGKALSVRGNHEEKLAVKLKKNTPAKEEVMQTIDAIKAEGGHFVSRVIEFIDRLPYVIICGGRFLIAHAGLKEEFQDFRTDSRKRVGKIKALTVYGDITGRTLEDGRPERLDWAASYKGRLSVVYGHSIINEVLWRNNTVNIDTGCFSTGILTAVRLPEGIFINNRAVQ